MKLEAWICNTFTFILSYYSRAEVDSLDVITRNQSDQSVIFRAFLGTLDDVAHFEVAVAAEHGVALQHCGARQLSGLGVRLGPAGGELAARVFCRGPHALSRVRVAVFALLLLGSQ